MELIQKLPTEYRGGRPIRRGVYLCPACGAEVTRDRGSAARSKHCGCLTPEQRARRRSTTTRILRASKISHDRWT
jgi:hypothetical protein